MTWMEGLFSHMRVLFICVAFLSLKPVSYEVSNCLLGFWWGLLTPKFDFFRVKDEFEAQDAFRSRVFGFM